MFFVLTCSWNSFVKTNGLLTLNLPSFFPCILIQLQPNYLLFLWLSLNILFKTMKIYLYTVDIILEFVDNVGDTFDSFYWNQVSDIKMKHWFIDVNWLDITIACLLGQNRLALQANSALSFVNHFIFTVDLIEKIVHINLNFLYSLLLCLSSFKSKFFKRHHWPLIFIFNILFLEKAPNATISVF